MWSIFHSLVGVNDEAVTKCQQVTNILKIARVKYKDLPKKVTMDQLCGLKYNPGDITVSQHIQALKIYFKWKDISEKRKRAQQNSAKQLRKSSSNSNSEGDEDSQSYGDDEDDDEGSNSLTSSWSSTDKENYYEESSSSSC